MKKIPFYKKNTAITLIALVITIIILLILSGITITALTGENRLFASAKGAKEKSSYGQAEEYVRLAIMGAVTDDGKMTVEELTKEIENYNGTLTGTKFPVEVKMNGYIWVIDANGIITEKENMPDTEVLTIGSTVKYSPSGTYNWQAKYCSTKQTEDVLLNSAETDYKISEWKVLDIENGKVTLIAATPTTGKVYLGQAQGYNNGVKLLNDACNNLYGNKEKEIIARSINIEDIEKYMTPEALEEAHKYVRAETNTKYGEQISSPYTSKKHYPIIYAKENLSVINGTKKENGLGMSEQITFIEKTENNAIDGKIEATTSLQPYQTYWYKNHEFMQTGLKTASNGTKYYDLIIPKALSTKYWIASRAITFSETRGVVFSIRNMFEGRIGGPGIYFSNTGNEGYSQELFPVVSVKSELISRDKINGFVINL